MLNPTETVKQLEAKDAEISRLRVALAPFADYGSGTGRKVPGQMQVSQGSNMARRQIIMSDCHQAADAMGLK